MKHNRRAEDPRPRQTVWDDFADNVDHGLTVLSVILLVVAAVFGILIAFQPG